VANTIEGTDNRDSTGIRDVPGRESRAADKDPGRGHDGEGTNKAYRRQGRRVTALIKSKYGYRAVRTVGESVETKTYTD
jgi:hypothetical protein